MTLFKTWEQHYINGTLPKEWPIWEDCRTWAINNRYKIEYGYKGEFSPEGCLKAMPGYMSKEKIAEKFNIPAEVLDKYTDERITYLEKNNTLAELKQIATDIGINTEKARTKKEIATIIAEGGNL